MDTPFHRRSKAFTAHIFNVFPLVLVCLSLLFVQFLPLMGEQISKSVGIEVCSSLGTKYVYSVDDIADQDKERNFCVLCSVQSSAIMPELKSFSVVELIDNRVLYRIDYQNPAIHKLFLSTQYQPRAPPVIS